MLAFANKARTAKRQLLSFMVVSFLGDGRFRGHAADGTRSHSKHPYGVIGAREKSFAVASAVFAALKRDSTKGNKFPLMSYSENRTSFDRFDAERVERRLRGFRRVMVVA
jgi:hypothetical protein